MDTRDLSCALSGSSCDLKRQCLPFCKDRPPESSRPVLWTSGQLFGHFAPAPTVGSRVSIALLGLVEKPNESG